MDQEREDYDDPGARRVPVDVSTLFIIAVVAAVLTACLLWYGFAPEPKINV